MLKSITLLVIAILFINVVVIGISLIQQTGKLNEAGADVASLESEVITLTGEITILRNNISGLQASIAESDAKSAILQTALNKANTDILNSPGGKILSRPTFPVNPTGPAVFVTSDLKINEILLQPADTATVSVMVTNTGGQTGTYPVVLKVNGATFDTKSVTLDGGESTSVHFGVKSEGGKEMKAVITIDNLSVDALWEVH